MISGLICKFFGALFRLPLTNILSLQGIGIFQMVMSLYSLSLSLVSGGVTSALSKLVSGARAKGQEVKIGGYFRYGLLFSGCISLAIGAFFFIFSNFIAVVQGAPQASASYMLLALLLPLGAIIGVLRGIIQGYENMTPTAISQIIEQAFKFCFGLLFAYLFSQSTGGGVFGAFLGITIAEALALIYLTFVIKKSKIKAGRYNVRKEFFKAVTPLTLSNVILPLAFAIETLIIVSLLASAGLSGEDATTLYGLSSGVVGAIMHFPLVISLSVAVSLLPKISFLSAKKDAEAEKRVVGKAFSMMWFLLFPLVVGINNIARVLYPLIYPSVTGELLTIACQLSLLSGIAVVLNGFSQVLNSILQAKGFYNYSLLFLTLGGIGKVLSLIIFTPINNINIFALPISNIVLYSIICICALIKLGSAVKINFFNFLLPLLSSIVMYMVVKLWLTLSSSIFGIIGAVILGGLTYLILCLPLVLEYSKDFKRQT